MIVLALDTTTRAGSVAVAEDDRVLALVPGDASRTHGERLPAEIASALEHAGLSRDRVDLLAVAAGPGAFTGLRIGLAAMQGLAMTLGKPVAGVSALDALAAQVSDAGVAVIAPWMDAQRGDVFASLVDARTHRTIEAALTASPGAVADQWAAIIGDRSVVFIGDAVSRDAGVIAAAGKGRWRIQAPGPLAPQIAVIGRRMAERGEAGLPHALTPIYVRRPDAEIERERRGQP
ncbi:MAG TPA: tRNA (adenosine(37)-N6)-threonylcarbamoyltransferase complex dimerization subunit type 1 TsaB [Vicinamibacterales bacterium]|nr:tRNA (adenosine(37)-N6)-threonylcarbamoyltransferase complex dimerization subunit type 1 TsaB [Vicinamibacterales bacterium]